KVSGRIAERLAESEPNGAIWANQFDNVANRQAHIEGTGPEIWHQTNGRLDAHGTSITEGIGQNRVTANLEGAPIDDAYEISDEEALPLIFDLLEHEGLCMGGSTGINVAVAMRMAKEMGKGHTIVTILADYGTRYQSKLFNP